MTTISCLVAAATLQLSDSGISRCSLSPLIKWIAIKITNLWFFNAETFLNRSMLCFVVVRFT